MSNHYDQFRRRFIFCEGFLNWHHDIFGAAQDESSIISLKTRPQFLLQLVLKLSQLCLLHRFLPIHYLLSLDVSVVAYLWHVFGNVYAVFHVFDDALETT